jgi:hypothetical protein
MLAAAVTVDGYHRCALRVAQAQLVMAAIVQQDY